MISTKYERTVFHEEKVKLLLELGVISAGAKLSDGKIELPEALLPETGKKKPEKAKAQKPAEKPENGSAPTK